MKRIALVLTLILLAGSAQGEVVRLQDGRLLQGKITSHTGLEVRLHRFDTGGEVTIPFKDMLGVDRERIEKKLGYRTFKGTEKNVAAHRLTLKNGKRVTGVMDEKASNPKTVVLVRRGMIFRYSRDQVVQIDPVEVPAGEVYTPQRIYELELAKLEEESPRGHYELARLAESLGLYEKASEHYKKARELKPEDWKIRTDAAIARLDKLIQNKEAMQAYRAVISANARKAFDKARELATELYTKYTDVEFPKDQTALNELIDTEEKTYLNKQVLRRMHVIARNLAWEHARLRTNTVDEALQYGSGQMQKDVLAKLAEKIGADEKKILQAFNERQSTSTRKLNLGSGSFLVGQAGGKGGSSGGRYGSSGGSGGYTVKIGGQTITVPKGVMGGGRGGRRGGNNKKKVDPRKEWWQAADIGSRRAIVYGAWVLKNLEIVREDKRACSTCGGKGTEDYYTTQGRQQRTCGRCHGAQFDRVLVFK